jgi:H+/Cl- antiporter ClcA/CBS domain-containing protein
MLSASKKTDPTGRTQPAEAKNSRARAAGPARLGDFTTDLRVLGLAAMAVLVGAIGVVAAWGLLRLITLCTDLAYFGRFSFAPLSIADSPWGVARVLVPVAGCLIVGFMARYGSEKIRGHGIPEAMEAILIGKSRLQPKVAVLKPLSSAISIGTGGPFGAEGPIIMTGGAAGSLIAQFFHMTSAERKTMLVAGAAAGMTAVFGTPIAAVLLAVELLLVEWKPRSFIPVAVAAIVAAAGRTLLLAPGPLFPFSEGMSLSLAAVPEWALIGVTAGLGSGLLTAMVYAAENGFQKLPIHWMWWPALGGLVVGLGGLIEPSALGVGYDNIRDLLQGNMLVQAVLLLLVVKAVIWAVALGSGTSGGVLAPLLIMGGAIGSLEGLVLPGASLGFWALLGMAAMMGGTMRSPLTATLFAFELTGDIHALLPLLTACVVSYAVTVLLLKRSILTEKVARRGHHVSREYHVDPFDLTWVADVMVKAVDSLPSSMTVAEAVTFFTAPEPRHKSYPVIDATGQVVAMVSRADILHWAREKDLPPGTLGDVLSGQDILTGYPDELVGRLADRMAAADAGRVPILDRKSGSLVGIVARKDLLRVRANLHTEERERARFLGLKSRER